MLLHLPLLFFSILNDFFTVAGNYIFQKNQALSWEKKHTRKEVALSTQEVKKKKTQTIIGVLRIINSSFILCAAERLESILKVGQLNTSSYSAFSAVLLTKSRMKFLIYNFNYCRHPPSPQPHITWRKWLFFNKTRGIPACQPAQGILKSELLWERKETNLSMALVLHLQHLSAFSTHAECPGVMFRRFSRYMIISFPLHKNFSNFDTVQHILLMCISRGFKCILRQSLYCLIWKVKHFIF